MLDTLLILFEAVIDALLWIALWVFVAALGFLAFTILLCLLRPFGLALAFMWNVAADIVPIVSDACAGAGVERDTQPCRGR